MYQRDLGEIIILKNIVFKNGQADHASLTGRPCLLVSENNDYLYALPITHRYPRHYINHYYYQMDVDTIVDYVGASKYSKKYVNLREIIRKEIYGYVAKGKLKDEYYYDLIVKLLNLPANILFSNLYFNEIQNDLISQKEKFAKRYSHHL